MKHLLSLCSSQLQLFSSLILTLSLSLLQLRSSMGLSIASAICSLVRIMLLITDMVINNLDSVFSSIPAVVC